MSLFTNAEADALSLDGLVNDNALVPTRRNGPKPSYQFLVDGWNAEFAAKIIEINKSRGFRVVGTFSAGFTYELLNDVGIDAAGNSWIYTGTDALPKVISAGTAPSTPNYQQVTYNDHSGLVNLNAEGGHDEIYARSVNSLKSLVAYTPTLIDGQKFDVTGFYANTKVGGGVFTWDASRSKTEHNGGTVIAPEAITAWDGSQVNLSQLLNWTGAGGGCFVLTSPASQFSFGALGDGIVDDTLSMSSTIVNVLGIDLSDYKYVIKSPLPSLKSGSSITGSGAQIIWNGTDDISNNDRKKGIFNAHGAISATNVAVGVGDLVFGSDQFNVQSGHSISTGDYINITGEELGDNSSGCFPSINLLCRVTNVNNNIIYIDHKLGWSMDASVLTINKVEPLTNIFIGGFTIIDNQLVTPSPNSNTVAPILERNKAVSGISVSDATGIKIDNIEFENTKYPAVLTTRVNDSTFSNLHLINPKWFGPGEGYLLQLNGGTRNAIDKITSDGCRHIVDFTGSSYCKVSDASAKNSMQNAFITHGAFEHDITWIRCYGNVFSPASSGFASFGNFAHTLKCESCHFDIHAGWGISVLFENCSIGYTKTSLTSKISLVNTEVRDWRGFTHDVTSRIDAAKTRIGAFNFDSMTLDQGSSLSVLNREGGHDIGLKGFESVKLYGAINWLVQSAGFRYGTFEISSAKSVNISCEINNVRVKLKGLHSSAIIDGARFFHNIPENGGAAIFTENLQANGSDCVSISLINTLFNINNGAAITNRFCIAYQFLERTESTTVNVALTIRDNTILNDSTSSVGRTATYNIVHLRNRDNYIFNAIGQPIIDVPDTNRYAIGDVLPTKGTSSTPAVFDGFVWITI